MQLVKASNKVKKCMKEVGATRVEQSAVEELAKFINNSSEEIIKKAIELANYAGRKTINSVDITLAAKMVFGSTGEKFGSTGSH